MEWVQELQATTWTAISGLPKIWWDSENGLSVCLSRLSVSRQVFSIGTVAAYSAKYSALVAYKILELFQ